MSKDFVKVGVIGLGNMGSAHAVNIMNGVIPRMKLTAVCDIVPERMNAYDVPHKFTDSREMVRCEDVDAVIIATPHYFHTTIGIDAFAAGKHVLTEKPISVHKADCERLIAAHAKAPEKKFAAMFNLRTLTPYIKLRELVAKGELGELRRVNWIITTWFRPQYYYDSGGWRATWRGEGGGVLLNQCPHNLDLLQWICGMPVKMRAFCKLGKYHNIEVEDDVTAYFEYANGATGVFIATTGEAPGTNRLEITGDNGKIIYENGKITFYRTTTPVAEFNRTSKNAFGTPEIWTIDIPAALPGLIQHNAILKNFADAILDDAALIAPAEEGINSVELANAMIYSSALGKELDLPMNSADYEKFLMGLIETSKFQKQTNGDSIVGDMSATFGR